MTVDGNWQLPCVKCVYDINAKKDWSDISYSSFMVIEPYSDVTGRVIQRDAVESLLMATSAFFSQQPLRRHFLRVAYHSEPSLEHLKESNISVWRKQPLLWTVDVTHLVRLLQLWKKGRYMTIDDTKEPLIIGLERELPQGSQALLRLP